MFLEYVPRFKQMHNLTNTDEQKNKVEFDVRFESKW